jgi:MFS family permease
MRPISRRQRLITRHTSNRGQNVQTMKGSSEMIANYLGKLRLFGRDVRLYLISWALVQFAVSGILVVLLNLYLLRLGYGPEFVGLLNAAAALVFSVSCLPAGALGRRWGSRRPMIAGLSLFVVGIGLLPLAEFIPNTWQAGWLLASSILAYGGYALYVVNGSPFLMGSTTSAERDHAFSAQAALGALCGFAGSLVGGMLPGLFAATLGISLDQPAPYRYPLWVAAGSYVLALLALLPTREVRARQPQKREAETGRAPYGLIALLALVYLLCVAGWGAVQAFFNVYLDAELGLSTPLIGAVSAAGQLLSVPAALSAPLLMARWGKVRTFALGSLGVALSLLPLAFIPRWGAAGLGFMGMTALFWMADPTFMVYHQEIVAPGWRATASGAVMMAVGLSYSAMALAGGYLIGALGYRSLFLTGAGLTAAGALLFWAYFRVPRGELARGPAPEQTEAAG